MSRRPNFGTTFSKNDSRVTGPLSDLQLLDLRLEIQDLGFGPGKCSIGTF